mgnify:CR=1 FL=1
MHCDTQLQQDDIVTVHSAYGKHGKLVVTSHLTWRVIAWNLSMYTESGETVCIKPIPDGPNLILDRNWLTFVSRPFKFNEPIADFDDDIPF